MPLLFFLSFLIFGAGAAGLAIPFSTPVEPVDTVTVNPCYQLEGTRITLDPSWLLTADCQTTLDSRAFLRLRQQVGIIDAKIREGEGAHPGNDCGKSYYGSLRKVGTLPAGASTYDGAKDIFWENENYLHDDLSNFILINTEKKEGKHYFDVYIDENEKDKLKDDPKYEFIRSCKETGGLVPLIEGPATPTFPPQAISLTDEDFNNQANQKFDKDGSPFGENFDKYNNPNVYGFEGKYFIRIDPPEGQEVQIPVPAEQLGFFYKTIAPETRTYDVLFHAGIIYLRDQSDSKPYIYNPSDTKPPFAVRRDPTLQLTALHFITVSEWTWATPECKPALYLYPEKPTKLTVKLNPAGKLTITDPEYDEKSGWEAIAYPDGTLRLWSEDKGEETGLGYGGGLSEEKTKNLTLPPGRLPNPNPPIYPYLYYEAEIEKVKVPGKGWVVKREELETLFNELLPYLGLNQNERVEFKKYWLGVLDKSPYYFVGLVDKEELERIEPIKFSQNPDTFIRVRLFFEPLEKPISVEPPRLPPTPSRQGFVAVDWGGILSSGTCQAGEAFDAVSR